ncbi:MAG: hypothetical protein M4579_005382 [Chaenotheca gracillima]|nr:MAG: hypothetical protein M4579_005382 [Chaenotheca gracillima]
MLSATVASLFAGTLSDSLGRTRAIALGSFTFALGAAIEAGAANLGMLIAGRLVVGVGEGFFLSTIVVDGNGSYVCEISPPSKRGILASLVQLLISVGLCLGYFTCYGTTRIASSLSWRLPLALQAGIAMILAFISYFCLPQSPRWLSYKGRHAEAVAAWDRLGVSSAEREKDLLESSAGRPGATAVPSPSGLMERWRRDVAQTMKIFAKDVRGQALLGIFMMSMQQLSGIDGVLYYAPVLFQQAGLSSSKAAFLASGVSAILIVISSIPAFLLADRWGRRGSTIYGGIVLSLAMALMGTLYASHNVHADTGAGKWVVIITIYVFAVAYNMTWALGVKIFASEIQPVSTRAKAISLAQSANCMTNFFVAFITPVLLAHSSSGAYFMFAGTTILTVIVCSIFMPETRGHSLEAINESFHHHVASNSALIQGPRRVLQHIRAMVP